MSTTLDESPVIRKTRELCQAILDQPDVQNMRRSIETFMANDKVRGQYENLVERGQVLQEKQRAGDTLSDQEVAAFEKLREAFLGDPVARGYLDAQEEMHRLQESVTRYVSKTFELGHVPEESDLDSGGSCGHGCGCHH